MNVTDLAQILPELTVDQLSVWPPADEFEITLGKLAALTGGPPTSHQWYDSTTGNLHCTYRFGAVTVHAPEVPRG